MRSGVTSDETRASPSPQVASITRRSPSPETGSAVKTTTETSQGTNRWTTTAIADSASHSPPRRRLRRRVGEGPKPSVEAGADSHRQRGTLDLDSYRGQLGIGDAPRRRRE